MATIENKYTGDGSTTKFSITFEYLRETDVKATVNKVATTAFTFANATTLEFTTAPPNTEEVRIFRDTATDELITEFFPGSAIRAQDLNDNANQVLFVGQEVKGRSMVTTGDSMTGDLVMEDSDIVFTGSTTNNNTNTTLTVVDPTQNNTITLPDVTGTVVTTGDSQTVTSTMITDGTIVDGDINASAEIAVSKLADGAARQLLQTDAAGTGVEWTDNVDIPGTLDVTGVTTFDSTVTATTFTGNLTGNSGTTTALQTARNIGGVSFDGTANINLPGVNAGGNQDTSGNAATATKLATPRNIAGVSFDGTANISIAPNNLTGINSTLTAADLNQLDANTLRNSGTTWTTNTDFPSATEVETRINSKIAPLGGFEAITDDESFPETQPAAGVIISIADAGGLVVDASGQSTTADTITTNAQVTINGFPAALQSSTVQANIGLMVVSTGAGQIYNYHRVIATDGDVIQLSDDINDFNNRYRPAAASDYTTDNDVGDTYFNTTTNTLRICSDATGNGTYVDAVVTDAVRTDGGTTGAGKIPVGTANERPSDGGTPATLKGYFRFNDDSDKFEGHNGTAWGSIGGGATGTGGDTVFVENLRTVTQSYTVGNSVISQAGDACGAVTVGPLIINSNATVTVPTNCNLVIL